MTFILSFIRILVIIFIGNITIDSHVPDPEVQVITPVKIVPAVKTSGRIWKKSDRYGFPPKILHIAMKNVLQ